MKTLTYFFSAALMLLCLGCSGNQQVNDKPFRSLFDNKKVCHKSFDTLGRRIDYNKYELFDPLLKGYPAHTTVNCYEFNDTAIVFAYDFEMGKVMIHDPDNFLIAAFPRDSIIVMQKEPVATAKLLSTTNKYPIARCDSLGVRFDQRESVWISHFRKSYSDTGLTLYNNDGYDFTVTIELPYAKREFCSAKERRDIIDSVLPPFLFYDWEQYQTLFYRYGREKNPCLVLKDTIPDAYKYIEENILLR